MDILFGPEYYQTCPTPANQDYLIHERVSTDIILKHSLITVSYIALSLAIIFLILDLIRHGTFKLKRTGNIFIIWLISIVGCIVLTKLLW